MKKQSQNKPNFKIGKMNATFFTTKPYENKPLRSLPENKPNLETEVGKRKTQSRRQRKKCSPPSSKRKMEPFSQPIRIIE